MQRNAGASAYGELGGFGFGGFALAYTGWQGPTKDQAEEWKKWAEKESSEACRLAEGVVQDGASAEVNLPASKTAATSSVEPPVPTGTAKGTNPSKD